MSENSVTHFGGPEGVPDEPEKPRMDESANGLWWMLDGAAWVIASIEFKSNRGPRLVIHTWQPGEDCGLSQFTVRSRVEANGRRWGGRILNPDEQPKPL